MCSLGVTVGSVARRHVVNDSSVQRGAAGDVRFRYLDGHLMRMQQAARLKHERLPSLHRRNTDEASTFPSHCSAGGHRARPPFSRRWKSVEKIPTKADRKVDVPTGDGAPDGRR